MVSTILIIDDSAALREYVVHAFHDTGYDVVEAADGPEGLAQLKREGNIVLVLCDIKMPQMSGLDVLKAIRAESKWSRIPVVMLTTDDTPSLMRQAKAAGASGWVIKPFRRKVLLDAVGRAIRSRRNVA